MRKEKMRELCTDITWGENDPNQRLNTYAK